MSRNRLSGAAPRRERRRGLCRPAAADGVLHRHQCVHRVQGLRGGLQAVERHAGGRPAAHRDVLRQHRPARRELLAARGVHRAVRTDRAGARQGAARADDHRPTDLGMPTICAADPGTGHQALDPQTTGTNDTDLRWLMSSDVCKHCTHAACLDVCPTGALFRTEFGTVVVQPDVCNGCGYCVPACPYGVIDQRKEDGRVFKCTHVLRPAQGGGGAGLREGVPDRLDPVRRARRPAGAGRPAGRRAARPGRRRCAAVWPGPRGRGGW